MTIKKIKKRYAIHFFKLSLQLILCLSLLGAVSCSKDDPVNEPESHEFLAKKKKTPVPYDKFSGALNKAKLQGPGSGIVKKKVKKGKKDVWVNVEKGNFKGYKSDKFYMAGNQMYFKSPKNSKKRTELRRLGDYEASASITSTGNLKVHSTSHKEFTVMQLHHSVKNSPLLKIEYKAKKNSKGKYVTGGFYAVNRNKPGASTSGRTKLLKGGSSAKFQIRYRPYTYTKKNGSKEARARVSVVVNNDSKNSIAIADIKQSDWGKGFYLKAGAYNQQSGEAKVSFSSLNW
ncbi:polysaccharide lyase family 7 protein [Aquimarina sp. AU119]|uniref:polysaccharide lyase family 7 protein n=1 Tax=Aquimarina sp. AU119 TaxID=2108528 RepID=UPI000D68E1B7|nr:polysaccharide lyase family 7 protein [Aquimarina sp. AU119]